MVSKILIISEMMIPFINNWGASQRIYHYAKKFVSENIQVTVICHNYSERNDGTEFVDGIKVIGLGGGKVQSISNEKSKKSLKSDLRKKFQNIDRNSKVISKVVRSFCRFLYSEPNTLSGYSAKRWSKSIMSFVLQYIKDENIDVVILSGPTFGLFYHAKEIKSTGVKLILDYRDPWISWYEKPTLAAKVEKKAMNLADLVITTTDTLTKELNNKYKTTKSHTIMNGYDKEQWDLVDVQTHNQDQMLIAYVGNIKIQNNTSNAGFRDATCFLNTVGEFIQVHNDVKVLFVGVQNDLQEIDNKFKKYVCFENSVPVSEALEITAKSDVLLMFHTSHDPSGKFIICGKAFDCMRSGNYLLSIGDYAYANKAFVEKTNSGIHCNNNREAILEALEIIYKKWKSNELIDKNRDCVQYSRDYQNNILLDLIIKI